MPSPNYSIVFFAPPVGASTTIGVGNVLITDASNPDSWVVSTTANRGTRRSDGVALSASGGSGFGSVEIQQTGTIDASISGLAPGVLSLVRCSATGTMERIAVGDVDPDTDDVIGYAEADGRVHLYFGFPFAEMLEIVEPGGADGDIQLKDGVALLGLGGPDGSVARRVAGAWVADPAVEVPAGATGDIVTLDGSGGLTATGALAGTKVAPNFGSQDVVTTGAVKPGALVFGSQPATIGEIRFSPDHAIVARNSANNANVSLIEFSSDVIFVGAQSGDLGLQLLSEVSAIVSAPIFECDTGSGLTPSLAGDGVNIAIGLPISGLNTPMQWDQVTVALSGSGPTTLTSAQFSKPNVVFTGTPTSGIDVVFPNSLGMWTVRNETPGNVDVRTSGGVTIAIATGTTAVVRGNSTNLLRVTANAVH